jgi:hypothetical protein
MHLHLWYLIFFVYCFLLLFAAGIAPVINTTVVRGNNNNFECLCDLFCFCYNTVRPNHDLSYTIGTNFCLELESPLNIMMNSFWVVSCRQLANQPIPPPTFLLTIEIVKTEMETELLMTTDQNLTFYNLNSTINTLLERNTSAIRVTCNVSNNFGSDNASTMIEPCGK